jgi:pimeloyl-ACP methyl ester carboxylesterase
MVRLENLTYREERSLKRDIRYVQTSLLDIAYEEHGLSSDFPVVLVHGWPDDIRSWDGVVERLVKASFRTIVPYVRGFGPTRFRDSGTMRSGQLSALGQDLIEMVQALGLDRFAVVGHDWGARAAYIAATELGQQISHLVAISVGYGTNNPNQELPLMQIRNYWYHWYFALPRGEYLVKNSRRELARFAWRTWSPGWRFSDAEFDATAASFDNPDWAEITIHSYRHRWGSAPGDPRYQPLEERLSATPPVKVPALLLHGVADSCNDPSTSAHKEKFFTSHYQRNLLPCIGHFPQREAPDLVANEILKFLQS